MTRHTPETVRAACERIAELEERVRVLREALVGVMGAEDQMAMPDTYTETKFAEARAALAATETK